MLASLLQKSGLFIGSDLDRNQEPLIFIRLNDWILDQAGSRWDNPPDLEVMFKNNELSELTADYLGAVMRSFQVAKYLGIKRLLRGETLFSMKSPWGWKDPRMTFTLPFWLKLFPEAKIIHLYRNGVDVAASLQKRSIKALSVANKSHALRKKWGFYNIFLKNSGFVNSSTCLDLSKGFALWENYVSSSFALTDTCINDFLHVKYEDILDSPKEHLAEILNFSGLPYNEEKLDQMSLGIDNSKGFSFRKDKHLLEFYEKARSSVIMERLGYN